MGCLLGLMALGGGLGCGGANPGGAAEPHPAPRARAITEGASSLASLPHAGECSMLEAGGCGGVDGDQPVSRWLWSPGIAASGCTGEATVTNVAVDGAGNILMVSDLRGTVDFGGTTLTGSSGDIVVAKVGSGGRFLWSQLLQRNNDWYASPGSIAVDQTGNVLVAGEFQGTLRIAGGLLTSGSADSSVFVVKLSPSGELLWARILEATSWTHLNGLATDPAGNVVLTGGFYGPLGIGDVEHPAGFGSNIYVAKLAASTGAPLWSRSFGNWEDVDLPDVALDAAGNVLLAASFSGTLDIDGTRLTASFLVPELAVTKLEGSTGLALWSRNVSLEPTADRFPRVAVDGAGNVGVVSQLGLGDASLRTVRLDSRGQVLWNRKWGDGSAYLGLRSMSFDASGNMLVSGWFTDKMDFGGGPRDSGAFLAWYDVQGDYLTDTAYSGVRNAGGPMGGSVGNGAAIDSTGQVVLGGSFQGSVDFGSGPLYSPCRSPFLLKRDPAPSGSIPVPAASAASRRP